MLDLGICIKKKERTSLNSSMPNAEPQKYFVNYHLIYLYSHVEFIAVVVSLYKDTGSTFNQLDKFALGGILPSFEGMVYVIRVYLSIFA